VPKKAFALPAAQPPPSRSTSPTMPPSRPRSRVENEVGGIGILVNNAGWDRMMNFVDTDPTF
jgi:hypothetical protein